MAATLIRRQTIVPDPLEGDDQLHLFDQSNATEPRMTVMPYRLPAQRAEISASTDYAILTWQTEWSANPPSVLTMERERAARLRSLARWSVNGMGLDLQHLDDIDVGWGITE